MNKVLIAMVVIVLLITAGAYVLRRNLSVSSLVQKTNIFSQTTPTPSSSPTSATLDVVPTESGIPTTKGGQPTGTGELVIGASGVGYADNGFTPSRISVKQGTTVRFTNQGSGGMWVVSDTHPTHRLLPDFNAGKRSERGGTYEYTFTKVGTWPYHNEVNASHSGTVVVTP